MTTYCQRLTFEWFRDAGEARVCWVRDPHPSIPGLQIVGAVEYRSRDRRYKVIMAGRAVGIVDSHDQAEDLARSTYVDPVQPG